MIRILLGILIIGLANLACGVESSTPAALPTYTPYPTFTPFPPTLAPPVATPAPATDVVSVLTENGFVKDGENVCDNLNPCTEYWNTEHQILVTVFGTGIVTYAFPINDDPEAYHIMDTLLDTFYGLEVDAWVADHLKLAYQQEGWQKGTVGGFGIAVQTVAPNNGKPPLDMIVIGPKGSAIFQ